VLGCRFDPDGDIAHPVVDWLDPVRLRQAEERIGHQVLRIARCKIARQCLKKLEFFSFVCPMMPI
jgi:hypothetical protein